MSPSQPEIQMTDEIEDRREDAPREHWPLDHCQDDWQPDGENGWDDIVDAYLDDDQGFDFDPPDDFAEESGQAEGHRGFFAMGGLHQERHDTADRSPQALMGEVRRSRDDRRLSEVDARTVPAARLRFTPRTVPWTSVPECELLVQQHVRFYLSATRPTITLLHTALECEIRRENLRRSMYGCPTVTVPSRQTFARRIARWEQYALHTARYGRRSAKSRFE